MHGQKQGPLQYKRGGGLQIPKICILDDIRAPVKSVKSAKLNLIVDDSVHTDGDGVPGEDLLGRHVKSTRS